MLRIHTFACHSKFQCHDFRLPSIIMWRSVALSHDFFFVPSEQIYNRIICFSCRLFTNTKQRSKKRPSFVAGRSDMPTVQAYVCACWCFFHRTIECSFSFLLNWSSRRSISCQLCSLLSLLCSTANYLFMQICRAVVFVSNYRSLPATYSNFLTFCCRSPLSWSEFVYCFFICARSPRPLYAFHLRKLH